MKLRAAVGQGRHTPVGSSDADVDGHPRRTRPPWRAGLLLFFVVLAIYGSSPVVTNGDSFLVVPTAHSLITQADLNIAESLGPGTDGGIAYLDDPAGASRPLKGIEIPREPGVGVKVYDYFPWLTAVAVTPLVAVFELPGALGVAPGVDVDQLLATGETGLLNLIGGSVLAAGSAVLLAALAWTGLAAVAAPRARYRRRARDSPRHAALVNSEPSSLEPDHGRSLLEPGRLLRPSPRPGCKGLITVQPATGAISGDGGRPLLRGAPDKRYTCAWARGVAGALPSACPAWLRRRRSRRRGSLLRRQPHGLRAAAAAVLRSREGRIGR